MFEQSELLLMNGSLMMAYYFCILLLHFFFGWTRMEESAFLLNRYAMRFTLPLLSIALLSNILHVDGHHVRHTM